MEKPPNSKLDSPGCFTKACKLSTNEIVDHQETRLAFPNPEIFNLLEICFQCTRS